MRFSEEELHNARSTNLIEFCERKGYELKPEGNGDYRVVGYAGLLVKDNYYYRHSTEESGNAVDFCVDILDMNFVDAVHALLAVECVVEDAECDRQWRSQAEQEKKDGYELPARTVAISSLYPYLVKGRKIPLKIVKQMIEKGLLYQDEYNNCVFPCYDQLKVPRGAIIRGTSIETPYKGRAAGSDMNYGWVYEPDEYCETVIIVEAPIDAMSLIALYPERAEKNYILALGGLHWNAIKTFLKENKQVAKIVLALDNDKPARNFIDKVELELELNYHIHEFLPKGAKDWNEILKLKCTA